MKYVTIALEDDVLRWAAIRAAQQGISVSRLLAEELQRKMLAETGYEQARRRFNERTPKVLKTDGSSYSSRDSLYER